jgi:hypothetical protein
VEALLEEEVARAEAAGAALRDEHAAMRAERDAALDAGRALTAQNAELQVFSLYKEPLYFRGSRGALDVCADVCAQEHPRRAAGAADAHSCGARRPGRRCSRGSWKRSLPS